MPHRITMGQGTWDKEHGTRNMGQGTWDKEHSGDRVHVQGQGTHRE